MLLNLKCWLRLLRMEWLLAARHPGIPFSALFMALISMLACFLGHREVATQHVAIMSVKERNALATETILNELKPVDRQHNSFSGTPNDTQLTQIASSAFLLSHAENIWQVIREENAIAAFSTGERDFWPYVFRLRGISRSATLMLDERLPPRNDLPNRFDLAFVAIVIAPLCLIALTFDLSTSDRQSGMAAMLQSQGSSLQNVVIARGLIRLWAMLVPLLVVPALLLLVLNWNATSQENIVWATFARLILWGIVVSLYLVFWLAMAVVIGIFGSSPVGNALTLLTLWFCFVFVIPSGIATDVDAKFQLNSYSSLVDREKRLLQELKERDDSLASESLAEIPTLDNTSELSDQMETIRYLAVQSQCLEEMEEEVRDHYSPIADRESRMKAYGWLSPVVACQTALDDLSGTSSVSLLRFVEFAGRVHTNLFRSFLADCVRDGVCTIETVHSLPAMWDEQVVNEVPLTDVLKSIAPLATWAVVIGFSGLFLLRVQKT